MSPLLWLLVACRPEAEIEPGSLSVSWTVGPDGCAAGGVDSVVLEWAGN